MEDSLKLPDTLNADGLLVGWSLEHMQNSMPLGFALGNPECCPETGFQDAIMFENRGNILTLSNQRGVSDANCLVPALLRHDGPTICLTGSSCAYRATAKARQARGDDIVILDPYGLSGATPNSLNPFSLLDAERQDLQEKARTLATLICPMAEGDAGTVAVVARAQQFLAAVLLFQVLQEPPAQRTLQRTRSIIFDSPQELKRLLDLLAQSPHEEVRHASSFLGLTPPEMLTAILSVLHTQLQFLNHQGVVDSTSSTGFDLDSIADGEQTSIYILLPAHQLSAYQRLGQLWTGTFLEALGRRVRAPQANTLVMIDQAQDLGFCETLLKANSHLGAAGVHLWTVWADADAIRTTYPTAWRRFFGEAWVIQAFGTNTMVVAQEIASVTGFPKPAEIMDLDHDEMILVLAGDQPVIAQRVNGFHDPVFKSLIDRGSITTEEGSVLPPKQRPQRRFIRQEPVAHLPVMSDLQLSRLAQLAQVSPAAK